MISTAKSNVPDLILIAGTLPESATTRKGASLHFRLRRGQPFPGAPPLVWTIDGEKGDIRFVSPDGVFFNIGFDSSIMEVHDFETGKVEKIDHGWEVRAMSMPRIARNIGRLYELFARSQQGEKPGYPTFEDAQNIHEQLEALIAEWSA